MLAGLLLLLTGCFNLHASWDYRENGTVGGKIVLRVNKFYLMSSTQTDYSEIDCEDHLTSIMEDKGHSLPVFLDMFNILNSPDYAHNIRWEKEPQECVVTVNIEFSPGRTYEQSMEKVTQQSGDKLKVDATLNRAVFELTSQRTELLADYILDEDPNRSRLNLRDAKITIKVTLPSFTAESELYPHDDINASISLDNNYHKKIEGANSTEFVWDYETFEIINFMLEDKSANTLKRHPQVPKSNFYWAVVLFIIVAIPFIIIVWRMD